MKPCKTILPENHRRSLSSTLMIVEQLLIDIEDLTTNRYKPCCIEIKNDISTDIIKKNLSAIEESRKLICNLAEKYNTDKTVQSLQRIVNAKKTKIWEILCDSKAKRLKGFGEFPPKLVIEFDNDIDELMATADRIKY
jgi:TIR domain